MMKLLSRLVALFVLAAAFGGSSVAIAFDETHLQKLKKLNACEECDLSVANLKRIDMWVSNLNRANLDGANLSKANLSKTNLSQTDLTGANVTGANLTNAILSMVNLTWADLTGANLAGANVEGTIFCNTTMPDGTNNNSGC